MSWEKVSQQLLC